jgi:hypothetical protein
VQKGAEGGAEAPAAEPVPPSSPAQPTPEPPR